MWAMTQIFLHVREIYSTSSAEGWSCVLCKSIWLVRRFHGICPDIFGFIPLFQHNYYDVKSAQQKQCQCQCSSDFRWSSSWLMWSDFVTCLGQFQEDVQGRHQIKQAPVQQVNNQCPFGEYRPVGYGQQDWDWPRSSAVRATTSSVWGEVNREEGQCQGPNPFLWPLSSGAVVKPQGRQLYQHDLGLRVVSFTQTPLNSHQSRLCASSKHREKQQTLNNYRPRGGSFLGLRMEFRMGWKECFKCRQHWTADLGVFWQWCKYSQR